MNPFRGALALAGLSPIGLAIIVFGCEAHPALPLVRGNSATIAAPSYVEFGVGAIGAEVGSVDVSQIGGAADTAGAADIVVSTITAAERVVAHFVDRVLGVGHTEGPRGLGIIVGIVVLAAHGWRTLQRFRHSIGALPTTDSMVYDLKHAKMIIRSE